MAWYLPHGTTCLSLHIICTISFGHSIVEPTALAWQILPTGASSWQESRKIRSGHKPDDDLILIAVLRSD